MTEEKLDQPKRKSAKGRISGLFLALFAIFVIGLWLLRQPIAEAIARGACAEQGLSCELSITRLDPGGLTLTSVDARAPGAADAAVSAREVVIDLAWDNPFAPRAAAISGDNLQLRVDLTGNRSVLGDLEQAITTFTKPTAQKPGPLPRLQFTNLSVVGDTLSGPLLARGHVAATGQDAFTVELTADPASLGVPGATMDLAAAHLNATVTGQDIAGKLHLDLKRFTAQQMNFDNVKIDATLSQVAGKLSGEGRATLGGIATKDGAFAGADAWAQVEAAAINTQSFELSQWLANVESLSISSSIQGARFGDASLKSASLRALILPIGANQSGGDVTLVAEDLRTPQAVAGRLEVKSNISIKPGDVGAAAGTATITSGLLTAQQRSALTDAIAGPLESILPAHADSLRRALDRAGQSFGASFRWSAVAQPEGFTLNLFSGAELKSASGLALSIARAEQDQPLFSYESAAGGRWLGNGTVSLSGGGAPPVTLDILQASGAAATRIDARATLKPWRIGDDVVAAEIPELSLDLSGAVSTATGRFNVTVDGGMAGGAWKGITASSQVSARWTADTFTASAPQGALIKWERAAYGGATFGAGKLLYTPKGPLATRSGKALVGQGTLVAFDMPVTGEEFSANVKLGAIAINWRTTGDFNANFRMSPSSVDVKTGTRDLPIRIANITGALDLSRGWKVAGGFSGATASAPEGEVRDISGKFDLAGKGDALSGALTGLAMRFHDPLDENRRYEDANFRGESHLNNGKVDFTGTINMAKSGMQVAHIIGHHDLDNGAGALSFEPTPFIFRPRQFQPSDISPLLTGPANVTGRVDIGGAAGWNAEGFKASGVLDIRKLGFALASAGVFEGVSGRVEIADLLALKSAPNQRITLEKVTLGLPIEKGTIDFQLIGYDAIRLQNAEWPFGGGFIRIAPTDFRFAGDAENRVVARAVDWDLAKLSEQFKLPDMKLSGVVGGEFPVVFTTGSAVIDDATLVSVKPGVIQYSGSTGDAAAQANENSKMLFDALKDFRYEVLKVGLDGNLTGRMMLTLGILGRNPDVLSGQPFQLNIGIDSALVPLLTSTTQRPDVRTAIELVKEDLK